MYKICIFAGTTEGRRLTEFLSRQKVSVTACTATEYGGEVIAPADNLTVLTGKMPVDDITAMLKKEHFDMVIDATHPYAVSITDSISQACRESNTASVRLLRQSSDHQDSAFYAQDIPSAVDFLNSCQGNILLTTGSKELLKYTGVKDFAERVYARVLPMASSLAECEKAGLKPSHIIAMQGPFSEDMNTAMLKSIHAACMVTKDSGDPGGFSEKAAAARKAGAKLVIIGRPPQKEGISYSDTVKLLCSTFKLPPRPDIVIAGIGPGSTKAMTGEVYEAVSGAECLIGASRMLQAYSRPGQVTKEAITPDDISGYISDHPEFTRITVVMSGDTGFFSGTKKLLPALAQYDVRVYPGLSSMSYLCAKIGCSYDDAVTTTVHGRDHSVSAEVKNNQKVFVLSGGKTGINDICADLISEGLGNAVITVGERLSYDDEKITTGTAVELADGDFAPLSAALIINPVPSGIVTHGLPDSAFQRNEDGALVVPMTKSEVRSVCLSKLQLTKNAVCWDVGAGTGSVSIEMAMQAAAGHIYAIEKNASALELLETNVKRFRIENLEIISGSAPEALAGLAAPDRVFIGGSSGNINEIIDFILKLNPQARIVATAVTMESAAQLTQCLKSHTFTETEIVSMNIARDRKAGPYHLMTALNPVYIFTMQNKLPADGRSSC